MASSIARQLAASPLGRAGGALLHDLLVPASLAQLNREVTDLSMSAKLSQRSAFNDVVCGDPDRALMHIEAGPILDGLYTGADLAEWVQSVSGVPMRPLGAHTSYSVYSGDHFLGPHRDIDGCDLTVIVVVRDDTPGGQPLWLWPSRADEPVDRIRQNPQHSCRSIVGAPGQAVVIMGRVVPHQLPQMKPGCTRIVAPLCFTVDPSFQASEAP